MHTFTLVLHVVTLDAVVLHREGVLAVVACAAGSARFHLSHGGRGSALLVFEDLGVAIGAFEHPQMESMVEEGFTEACLPGKLGRLEARVALTAVTSGGKGILAVMAGAAGFTFFHVGHGVMFGAGPVCKEFRVAIGTLVHAEMEVVAEGGVGNSLDFERHGFRRRHSLVAFAAVAGHRKCLLAVMAGAAGFPLLHLGHGNLPGTDNILVAMAGAAFAAELGDVKLVLEDRISGPLHLEDYWAGLAFVAANAFSVIGNAEGLDAGVAGAA